MSLITYNGLCELVASGVITPVPPEHINGASIDVRLGDTLWCEDSRGGLVNLVAKQTFGGYPYDLAKSPYRLAPGEFVLAQTIELFNLPNTIAPEFRLKSSVARAGLDAALAMWADPGWNGSVLTLELRNNLQHHALILTAGMRVGQMVFFRGEPVPEHASYATRGRYNNNTSVTPSKGV